MGIEVKVKMLRAVGGFEVGDYRPMRVADAERLEARGIVQIVSKPAHPKPRPAKKRRGAKAQGASPKTKAEGRSGSTK